MSTQKDIKLDDYYMKKNGSNGSEATQSSKGLMSQSDKQKLDGVAVGANNYVHPNNYTGGEKALYKVQINTAGHVTDITPVSKSDITTLGISSSDHTHDYLSPSDVKNNLTSTDTNKPLSAKQGKELKTLVDGKSDSNHTHALDDLSSRNGHSVISDNGSEILFLNDTLRLEESDYSLEMFDMGSNEYQKIVTENEIEDFLTEHQDISGKEDISNKVTSWSNSVSNTKYPSEKLVKDSLDEKALLNHNHDGVYLKQHQSLSDIGGAVTIEEKSSANSGAFKTYQIKQGGVAVSGEIDIPKDFLVKSGSVKIAGATPTTAESNAGVNANEKYISLIVNTKDDNSNTGTELIIPATNLVDTYTAGTGLTLTNQNQFKHSNSVTAQSTQALKKIAYDSEGHITSTSNVEASDLPTHYHSQYLTSHQDISGKLDKSQTSYKGKNVVVDGSSGNITFEDKPTLSSLSIGREELQISDIATLSEGVINHWLTSQYTMSLSGGASGKTCTITFYRIGQLVYFKINATYEGSSFNANVSPPNKTVNIGDNIPEEFRPINTFYMHLNNYGTVSVSGGIEITHGGTISLKINDVSKTMYYYTSGMYITDYVYTDTLNG